MSIKENLKEISKFIPADVCLIVVTKNRSDEEILAAYNQGYRIFGENRVQEIIRKKPLFPEDIEWHIIGHLQTNKVKQILPHIQLIHGVDSEKLLQEINKESGKQGIKTKVLLQIFIATEESKFGLDVVEAENLLQKYVEGNFNNLSIQGLMGMASNVDDPQQIENEFSSLQQFYKRAKTKYPFLKILSMGMSGDYQLAIKHGSTMVRIGSAIFNTNPA
jgi:PLP dependent protein